MPNDKYAGRAPQHEALAHAVESAEGTEPSDAAAGLREARWRAHGGPAAAEAQLGRPVASFAEYLEAKARMSKDGPLTDAQ